MKKNLFANQTISTLTNRTNGVARGYCGCGATCHCKTTSAKSTTDANKLAAALISPNV